jgi:hypothetical protein
MVMAVSGFKQPFAAISDGCAQVKISGYGMIPCCIIWLIRFGRLKVAKKSKKAKRGAPVRKKKGMKKAKPAKRARAKKRAPKPVPAPMAPPQPAPAASTLGGMTGDQ